MTSQALLTGTSEWWQVRDSNPRSTKRLIYSQIHLAALETCHAPKKSVLWKNSRMTRHCANQSDRSAPQRTKKG